jgi:transcriptional regulator with XRE-family HTH domain
MESNMKNNGFGYELRDLREAGGVSLRGLAKETGFDAAYLSRVERVLSPPPRRENIHKIAEALCKLQDLNTEECQKLKRTLLDSAKQLTNHKDLISDLRYRFADRLREEGLQESFIRDTMIKVSLNDMEKVLSGEEPLEIAPANSISAAEIKRRESKGESVKEIRDRPFPSKRIRPANRRRFRAGMRAFIEVDGILSAYQIEQLRSITPLIRTILNSKQ